MRENMQKIWQWIRDRKTNTLRKWRSTVVRTVGDEADAEKNGQIKEGRIGHSYSAISLPSNSQRRQMEYDKFFDEPQTKSFLDIRRQSFRESKADTFPVAPPDLDDGTTNLWIERYYFSKHWFSLLVFYISWEICGNIRTTPRTTPKTTPSSGRRIPRQIRFQIPEIQVSFEEENQIIQEERHSPQPPPEIEWISAMDTVIETVQLPPVQSLNFDLPDEVTTSSPRRHSASERARQNLLAQRRQSNVQLVQSMSGRRASTTLIPLSCAQIHLVRSLWRQIYTTKGPTVIGTSIYHRLCFKCPVVKEQIRRVSLPVKFQNHDSFIKAHSKAMAELIDQVVENLDSLDNMTDELIRIGKVHARMLRGELNGKLWNLVAETFIDCTLEWGDRRCRSETVRKAWALIVAFVVEKIKLGHHEQRKLMLATRQSLPSIDIPLSSMQI